MTRIHVGATGSVFPETKYLSLDILGRVTSSRQITDGMKFGPQTNDYNLSRTLDEQTNKIPAVENGGIFLAAYDKFVGNVRE